MKNPSSLLAELRPPAAPLDPQWSHQTLSRVLAQPVPPSASRPRRLLLVGATVAAISIGGAGVAAAAGLGPQSFVDAFGWQDWPGQPTDPATAERVATAPGPHGLVFSVLSTGHGQPSSCRTAVLETTDSARHELPDDFTELYGDFCSSGPTFPDFGHAGVSPTDDAAAFVVSAGTAVRAVVRTPEGREYPALLVDGDFWGWFPSGEHPSLTGYAADGTVVGRVDHL